MASPHSRSREPMGTAGPASGSPRPPREESFPQAAEAQQLTLDSAAWRRVTSLSNRKGVFFTRIPFSWCSKLRPEATWSCLPVLLGHSLSFPRGPSAQLGLDTHSGVKERRSTCTTKRLREVSGYILPCHLCLPSGPRKAGWGGGGVGGWESEVPKASGPPLA